MNVLILAIALALFSVIVFLLVKAAKQYLWRWRLRAEMRRFMIERCAQYFAEDLDYFMINGAGNDAPH